MAHDDLQYDLQLVCRNEVLYGKMAWVPGSTYYIATFTSGGDRIFDGSRHDHRGNERICE